MLTLVAALVSHALAAPDIAPVDWRGDASPVAASDMVRWRPHVAGVPVLDRSVSRRTADPRPLHFEGFAGSTVPTLDTEEAQLAAGLTATRATLGVSASHDRLVYDVHGDDAAGRPMRVWVDADDGRVLRRIPLERHAYGHAYVDSYGTVDEVELGELEGDGTLLANDRVMAFSAPVVDGERLEEAVAAPGDHHDFVFEPEDGVDAFAEVNAFYWTNLWLDELETFHGYVPPVPVTVRANYDHDDGGVYANASMLSGDHEWEMRLGSGPDGDFAHDPHVVVHELTHGVTSDLAGFQAITPYPYFLDQRGLNVAANALTEGIADYFAASVLDDSHVGRTTGLVVRELDDDRTCLEVVGEAHEDGMVVGATAWSLRERLGRDLADELVFRSVERLSDEPSFPEWAQALSETAAELVIEGAMSSDDEQQVAEEIERRELERCGRTLELTEEAPATQRVHGWDMYGEGSCVAAGSYGLRLGLAYQIEIPVPADAKRLTVDLDWTDRLDGGAAQNLRYEVWVSDTPWMLDVSYDERSGLPRAGQEPSPRAGKVQVFDDSPDSVEIKQVGKHDTMYLTVVHTNCTDADLTTTVTASDEGCGCSATGPLHGSLGGLFLITLAALRRRS